MKFDIKQFITVMLVQSVIFWGLAAMGFSPVVCGIPAFLIPIMFMKPSWKQK